MGVVLSVFANGDDQTPVSYKDEHAPIKSIGNSTTTPRDLENETDVSIIVYLLAESESARLRENHFVGDVIEISVRDNELHSFTRQRKISGGRKNRASAGRGQNRLTPFPVSIFIGEPSKITKTSDFAWKRRI